MEAKDKIIDIISSVNNEDHYIPISVAVRLAEAIIAAGPIVSEEVLAKLRTLWLDIQSELPTELRPYGFRAGMKETLTIVGLLDAVKEGAMPVRSTQEQK